MKCNLCPRGCNVDRTQEKGRCGAPDEILLARASVHLWEEPPISGTKGSGTVFFAGCNLGCVFCQNYEISHNKKGKSISDERLCEIFDELTNQGVHNINLVTHRHKDSPPHNTDYIIIITLVSSVKLHKNQV